MLRHYLEVGVDKNILQSWKPVAIHCEPGTTLAVRKGQTEATMAGQLIFKRRPESDEITEALDAVADYTREYIRSGKEEAEFVNQFLGLARGNRSIGELKHFVIANAKLAADLASASGPRPPLFKGDAHDFTEFDNWICRVALLSHGFEHGAANGETFRKRVDLAKQIMEAYHKKFD